MNRDSLASSAACTWRIRYSIYFKNSVQETKHDIIHIDYVFRVLFGAVCLIQQQSREEGVGGSLDTTGQSAHHHGREDSSSHTHTNGIRVTECFLVSW